MLIFEPFGTGADLGGAFFGPQAAGVNFRNLMPLNALFALP
jgi:hypothetical protein